MQTIALTLNIVELITVILFQIAVCAFLNDIYKNREPRNAFDFLRLVFLPYVIWIIINKK